MSYITTSDTYWRPIWTPVYSQSATTTTWTSGDIYWAQINDGRLEIMPMKSKPLLPPELFEFDD